MTQLGATPVRPRAVTAAVLAVLLLISVSLMPGAPRPATEAPPPGSPSLSPAGEVDLPGRAFAFPPSPPAPTPVWGHPRDVDVESDGFLSWAVRDRRTGDTLSSDNATDTSSTESMIKVWIVADYLRRADEDGERPGRARLRDARLAIRDSHNGTAQRLYRAGGGNDVVERMIDICGLEDTHIPEHGSGWWSRTEISAIDAVRLGECVVDGRAAGPEWTDWLLTQMRNVRGGTDPSDQRAEEGFEGGRWGIIDGVPESVAAELAIKNGWTRIGRTDSWHVSCLAVTDEWVMAVLLRYPAEYSLDYGAQRCESVARQLIGDRTGPQAYPMVPA